MRKNNLHRILAVILFVWVTGAAMAQVPGYIGKRFHIQGGIHFFPQFSNVPVNISQNRGFYVISGMNYRLALGMDFTITRKSVIGLNGHYFNTAGPMESLYLDQYSTYIPPDRRYAIEGGAVGLVFKTHLGSWVAPLGPYYKLEAGAMFNSVSDPVNNYNGTFIPQTYAGGYITTGFGRTHIFANRVSLDYGGEMGLMIPPIGAFQGGDVNLRMTIHYLATFYVKIGVIL